VGVGGCRWVGVGGWVRVGVGAGACWCVRVRACVCVWGAWGCVGVGLRVGLGFRV
jgi:hypothetical protein